MNDKPDFSTFQQLANYQKLSAFEISTLALKNRAVARITINGKDFYWKGWTFDRTRAIYEPNGYPISKTGYIEVKTMPDGNINVERVD